MAYVPPLPTVPRTVQVAAAGAWLVLVVAHAAAPDSTLAWRVLTSLTGTAASVAFAIAGFGALSEVWAAAEWRQRTGELAKAALEHSVRTVRRLVTVTVRPAGPLLDSRGDRLGDLASTFRLPPDRTVLEIRQQMRHRLQEVETELRAVERLASTAQAAEWERYRVGTVPGSRTDEHQVRCERDLPGLVLDPALVTDLVARAHECADEVRSAAHEIVDAATELCCYVGGPVSVRLTLAAQELRGRGELWSARHGTAEPAISPAARAFMPEAWVQAVEWRHTADTARGTMEEILTVISTASILESLLEQCRAELARRPGLRVEHVNP